MDDLNLGSVQNGRQAGHCRAKLVQSQYSDAAPGDLIDVRLRHQADPAVDKETVLRFQERRHGSALLRSREYFFISAVAVLAQPSAAGLYVAAPILGIDDDDSAGSNEDVVKVCLGPARPMDIVESRPAAGGQLAHFRRNHRLAGRPHRPGLYVPFGLFQLPSETGHTFRGAP